MADERGPNVVAEGDVLRMNASDIGSESAMRLISEAWGLEWDKTSRRDEATRPPASDS